MRNQLQDRLAELESEIAVGERRWHEVEQEQARLRETLLRMSGAIQVLREILESSENRAAPEHALDSLGADANDQNAQFAKSGRPAATSD